MTLYGSNRNWHWCSPSPETGTCRCSSIPQMVQQNIQYILSWQVFGDIWRSQTLLLAVSSLEQTRKKNDNFFSHAPRGCIKRPRLNLWSISGLPWERMLLFKVTSPSYGKGFLWDDLRRLIIPSLKLTMFGSENLMNIGKIPKYPKKESHLNPTHCFSGTNSLLR